jgi:hypothetical protein
MWQVLWNVKHPQEEGVRRGRTYPSMPSADWFARNVRTGKSMRIDARLVTCGKHGVWVQTKGKLNAFVRVPTNNPLVCHISRIARVSLTDGHVDVAFVEAYKYAGNNESGVVRNSVRTLFCVDLQLRLESVLVLPLLAIRDSVYLAPLPPTWDKSKPKRKRIWRQHRHTVHYVLPVDDI